MTQNLDPFGPPLLGAGYPPMQTGPVSAYEDRVRWLVEEAAYLIGELRKHSIDWAVFDNEGKQLGPSVHQAADRWINNYELHVCQIDYRDGGKDERPLGPPPTIDGEVL